MKKNPFVAGAPLLFFLCFFFLRVTFFQKKTQANAATPFPGKGAPFLLSSMS
jgi:hypothetical protein